MDELLHHCLRELSFDGELGSNVNRLKDFIVGCYENTQTLISQNLDDAFCAFAWSLIVQHPTVHVGLKPPGVTSEVWIAPQGNSRRKGKADGEELAETPHSKLVPISNAKGRPLAELTQQYGDGLRIAIEPEAIYEALTGTHIRTSKLSPMVYTALQIITRGRDNGVSVVDLGQQTKYDQKTCFYVVKQLTELGLVMKVRRGGVGTHFCIHKYFFERSPSWKAIREEENEAEEHRRTDDKQTTEADDDLEDAAVAYPDFTPIDARHLSSLPLIRARVVKLLQASKNHIHPSNNLLVTIGFASPSKTDRRFFQSRVRELLQQGVIEKVIVPSRRRKSSGSYVKCFRLVSDGNRLTEGEGNFFPDADDEKDEGGQEGIKVNLTLHRQIVEFLEDSGTEGMTLQDLSTALCGFDKRTIELLLSRAEKYPLPGHLRDLGIVSLMETSGRERRHRYYIARSYQALLAKEKFDSALGVSASSDPESIGSFSRLDATSFYQNKTVVQNYEDGFKDKTRTEKPRKHPPKNPIMPDGRVKRGRPRKRPIDEGKSADMVEPVTSSAMLSPETRPAKRRRLGAAHQEYAAADQVSRKDGRPQVEKQTPSASTAKSKKRPRSEGHSRGDTGEKELQKRVRPESEGDNPLPSDSPPSSSRQDVNGVGNVSVQEENEPFEPGVEEGGGQSAAAGYFPLTTTVSNHAMRNRPPSVAGPASRSLERTVTVNETAAMPGGIPTGALIPIDPELLAEQERSPSRAELRRPSKEAPGAPRTKVNVSHLRRENELYRVVVEQGGVVSIQSKEFYAAHKALIETLSRAGEPTSAPVGTTIDKRTLASTLDSLESRGRIKQLKTSVTTHTGTSRPISVIYLPNLPQDRLNNFLHGLSRVQIPVQPPRTYLKIDQQVDFGTDLPSTQRGALPLQLLQLEQSCEDKKEGWSKNVAKAKQLFSYDDDTIRNVLLTERTTLMQLFGFVVGKVARARLLHVSTLNAFDNHKEIPGVICPVHRIVDLSYYCHELPLELYCSFISVPSYDEELRQYLKNRDGRRTVVRSLPAQLHSSLQIGRSRARSRFLEIMEVLGSLGLVLPLQPSMSENASVCCVHDGCRRTFNPVPLNPPDKAPSNSFSCWWFCSQGPLRLWGLSEKQPPLWKQAPVATESEAQVYWGNLHEACINPDVIPLPDLDSSVDLSEFHTSLGRTLRRALSWTSDYLFTWHQTQYMKQFIDVQTGKTPLQEENEVRASKLGRISWVIGAPEESICHFYTTNHTKLILELEKARDRAKQRRSERKAQATTEAKALLARKAAEAKQQREEAWDRLLSQLHPSPLPTAALVRLKRIRTRFMQASTIQNQAKWENEIQAALHEADLIMKRLLRTSETTKATQPAVPLEIQKPLNGEKLVETLIAQQGPPIASRKAKGKRKGKDSQGTEEKRRHRFQWNHDYDELARDASAIIRARCRASSRLDWGAFEQVFPAVPRNTVRQRLAHLRESPGNEAYLNRLEERWHELWLQYRGTPALPDDDPLSPTNFELATHVSFLRAHIDKNALRVGFAQLREKISPTIPSSVDGLLNKYIVAESTLQAPIWDFMWNAAVEEGREKRLMHQSFTKSPEEVAMHTNLSSESVNVAEAALKIVFGTPHEQYDHEHASNLLKNFGDPAVESAKNNLLARGVLSKLVRDPQKQKPGRHLKISELNQNAAWGPVCRDIFQDATALEELSRQVTGWREWPLLASDGDAARLIEAVSNNTVKFRVDTSHAQQARAQLDWNSKKADDDQIETAISIQFDAPPGRQTPVPDAVDKVVPGYYQSHTSVTDDPPRCCKGQALNGLIDCEECLEEEWQSIASALDTEKDVAQRILHLVRDSGASGLPKPRLKTTMESLGLTDSQAFSIISHLMDAPIPLLFWSGYDTLVLIHSIFLSDWTVVTSDRPLTRSHPRRWNDVAGRRVPDYWQAAVRAVMGVIIFRPGITQYEIRWRLRSVYDRQEVNEILHYLHEEGYVSARQKDESYYLVPPLDSDEERGVFWLVGERAWYQV